MNVSRLLMFDEGFSAASEAEIQRAEADLGVQLPETYKAIVRIQNGGLFLPYYLEGIPFPGRGSFPLVTLWGIGDNGINERIGSQTRNQYILSQWGFMPDSVVLIWNAHGGIAVRYRPQGKQAFAYHLHNEGTPKITELCETFDALIAHASGHVAERLRGEAR